MEINIIDDVSKLTTIPKENLNRLLDVFGYCIADKIIEDRLNDQDVTSVDIKIGTLTIKHSLDEVKCRFSPSAKFSDELIRAITQDKSPLEKAIEKSLVEKITKTYKDIL